MRRSVLVVALVGLACSRTASTPPVATTMPSSPPLTDAGSALPAGLPWTLLRKPGRPVLVLDVELEGLYFDDYGIVAVRALRVEAPQLWLLVFEHRDATAAYAARVPLATWCDARGKPHYATGIVNGRYLLIAGFPGDKPVSPEMEAARTEYLSAFSATEGSSVP